MVRGFVNVSSVVESAHKIVRGFVNVSSVVESAREMVWWFVYVSSVVCFERLPNPQILQDSACGLHCCSIC